MIKYLSLFSGIGAFEKALENLDIDYDLIAYCEIEKVVSKAYSLLHNESESKNLWDITQVNEKELPANIDLITYGFPCQDISQAGLKQGFRDVDGNKTRSGLFFDALRIIEHCQPKVAVAENVKNLTSKSMHDTFDTVLKSLETAGYNSYWKLLNATDYSIPQSRERVFIVSVRKDIDKGTFKFPESMPLTLCMNDLLEDDSSIDTSFFLSEKKTKNVLRHNAKHSGHVADRGGICTTLLARDNCDPKVVQVWK